MPHSAQRILLVDDDPIIREMLQAYLSESGFETASAGDGVEALAEALDREYAVIVTDLVMPRMDGFELIDNLKAKGVRSKVIMLTALGSMDDAIRAFTEKGVFHFLRKGLMDLTQVKLIVQRAAEAYLLEREHETLTVNLEKAELLAITDGLTGLHTHRHFQERLAVEFENVRRRPSPLSLFFVDVDHFKRVNDAFGHQTGNACLRELSRFLANSVRSTDSVARYGGEEMAILLPYTTGSDAVELGRRLQRDLKRDWPPSLPAITVSIGVADYPLCASDGESLIAAADAAMITAKRTGRNRVVYYGQNMDILAGGESLDSLKDRLRSSAWAVVEEIARHSRRSRLGLDGVDALESAVDRACAALGFSSRERAGLLQAYRLHDLGAVVRERAANAGEDLSQVAEDSRKAGAAPRLDGEDLRRAGEVSRPDGEDHRRAGEASRPDDEDPRPALEVSGSDIDDFDTVDCGAGLSIALIEAVADVESTVAALRDHRERWDGSGRRGLTGQSIPAVARMLAVIEAIHEATGQVPMDDGAGLASHLRGLAGSVLDPNAVEAILLALGLSEVGRLKVVAGVK